jgi:lipid A oxidase
MVTRVLQLFGVAHVVLLALVLSVVFCQRDVRSYGDRLQIALPLVAYGCAITGRAGGEFFLRFATSFVAAHAIKRSLGETELNTRPHGGTHGFPSAHTTAAVVGASSLVHDCLRGSPLAQATVIAAAAFVGASRISVGAHDIWQVFAGVLLGWVCDRALRRESPLRDRIRTQICGISRIFGMGLKAIVGKIMGRGLMGTITSALMGMALMLPWGAAAETELSFYSGVQTAPHSVVTHSTLGRQTVGWKGRSFEAPPYYGLRAVWWRTPKLGFGIEVNHAKVYADTPAVYGYDRLEFTDGLNLITASVWRRFPNQTRLTPYVGAGLGVAVPHVDVQPTGQAHTFGYQLTGPAVQWVAGASWRLNDRWSLFGEYKGSYSKHSATLDSGGTLRTNLKTNALNLGVSYRF